MTATEPTRAAPARPCQPRFELGAIVTTPGALEACPFDRMTRCLTRHLTADWGCVDPEDAAANDEALLFGMRIISSYPIDPAKPCEGWGKNTLWIITEADRSATTFLLPEEY